MNDPAAVADFTSGIKYLSICHANVQSLAIGGNLPTQSVNVKIDEIQLRLCDKKTLNIICLTETWLKEETDSDRLVIDGYNIERKDRPGSRGGGASMYYKETLAVKRRKDLENEMMVF